MNTEQKYKAIKKKLGLTDKEIAKMFGYASLASYANSSGKPKIMEGIVSFYEKIGNEVTQTFDLGE